MKERLFPGLVQVCGRNWAWIRSQSTEKKARLFPIMKKLIRHEVDSIVVVAGMEGALASIVSSLVDIPVIGVPSSVGYGYGEKGVGALASMLQSCTLGLSVVNIDNGIGAGAFAASIANRIAMKKIRA